MISYGGAPSPDEIELTVFGPGFGEAIAIHLGDSKWVLIDSCINAEVRQPASLHYLSQIGVGPDAVRTIVASHWHDDHVRGMSNVVGTCGNAELVISGVFNEKEALEFLCAYGGVSGNAQTGGARELYNAIKANRRRFFAHQRSMLLQDTIQGRAVSVSAFSPTTLAQTQAKVHMAQYLPKLANDPINHAPDLSPNVEAVVVHIDFGEDAILLGSD